MSKKRMRKVDKLIIEEAISEGSSYFDEFKEHLADLPVGHRVDLVLHVFHTEEGIKIYRRLAIAKWVKPFSNPVLSVAQAALEGWEGMGSSSANSIED